MPWLNSTRMLMPATCWFFTVHCHLQLLPETSNFFTRDFRNVQRHGIGGLRYAVVAAAPPTAASTHHVFQKSQSIDPGIPDQLACND